MKILKLSAIVCGLLISSNVLALSENGFDRYGYTKKGYDQHGYNYFGYNKKGINKAGCNANFPYKNPKGVDCSNDAFLAEKNDPSFKDYQLYRSISMFY